MFRKYDLPASSKYFKPMLEKIRNNQQAGLTTESGVPAVNEPTLLKKKQKIPTKVRIDIWATYIGSNLAEHKCICCKKVTIKQSEFEVGHVLSEANGGTLEINNLRPICSVCNRSMGTRNMVDFVKQYGYFI